MKKSRLTLVKQVIKTCLNRDPDSPDLKKAFWSYPETSFFVVEVTKRQMLVGIAERPGGNDVHLLLVNKSLKVLERDLSGLRKIYPTVVVTLENKSDDTIGLTMGPEKGKDIDMLAFHHKFKHINLCIQETIGELVYMENIARKKQK